MTALSSHPSSHFAYRCPILKVDFPDNFNIFYSSNVMFENIILYYMAHLYNVRNNIILSNFYTFVRIRSAVLYATIYVCKT